MQVRSVANGNITDLPADHGLVVAGIYVRVDDEPETEAEPATAPAEDPVTFTPSAALDESLDDDPAHRVSALSTPEAPLMTTAHLGEPQPRRARQPRKQPVKKPPRKPRK